MKKLREWFRSLLSTFSRKPVERLQRDAEAPAAGIAEHGTRHVLYRSPPESAFREEYIMPGARGNSYRDSLAQQDDPSTASVEEMMNQVADRWDGLRAMHTVKVAPTYVRGPINPGDTERTYVTMDVLQPVKTANPSLDAWIADVTRTLDRWAGKDAPGTYVTRRDLDERLAKLGILRQRDEIARDLRTAREQAAVTAESKALIEGVQVVDAKGEPRVLPWHDSRHGRTDAGELPAPH